MKKYILILFLLIMPIIALSQVKLVNWQWGSNSIYDTLFFNRFDTLNIAVFELPNDKFRSTLAITYGDVDSSTVQIYHEWYIYGFPTQSGDSIITLDSNTTNSVFYISGQQQPFTHVNVIVEKDTVEQDCDAWIKMVLHAIKED